MNTVFNVLLSMSGSGALFILALFVGKRFWQHKISRQWQYYIWLIVILRLLLPFAPEWNLMETFTPTGDVDLAAVNLTLDNEKGVRPAQDNEKRNDSAQDDKKINSPLHGKDAVNPDFTPLKDMVVLLRTKVWVIWLAVAIGLLIRKITMYQSFVRCIQAGMTPVDDIALLERLSAVQKQAGVKRSVELCVNPLVSTPMLMGAAHPCIVLPSAKLPEKDYYYIVLHELMHHKRRDIVYKWLVELTVCLHWFNPTVYLMRRELAKACEFACDAAVLAKVGRIHAPDYGKTLLDAMAAVRTYRETVGTVPLSENKQLLKERLGAVMNYRKKSGTTVLFTSALTLGIVLSAAFVGVYPVAAAETDGRQQSSFQESRFENSLTNRFEEKDAGQSRGQQENDTFAGKIEQYYEEGSLPLFQIAFSRLDEEAKAAWLDRIYTDGRISFLGCAVNELEIDSAAVQYYAEKAYTDHSVSSFSIVAKRMSEKTLRTWLGRALDDQQFSFQSVLFGLLDDDSLAALEEEMDRQLDAAQRQEYLEHGIYGEGKTYYYESQLVHIFLDIRKEGSFYFLQVNPQGTVNVKVTRDEYGSIKSVGYMTEAEVEALLGDMEDAEEESMDEEFADEEFMNEEGMEDMGGYDGPKYDAPQIIAVNEQRIAAGAKLWFGDYDLRRGDKIQYDIEAETGDAVMIGFINNEVMPTVTYHSALVHREDGVLRCSVEFIRDEFVKDGKYKLYIYAPEGDLGNVKGSVSIAHAR